MLSRIDNRTGFNEGFEYDRLDRLTKTNVSGQTGGINYQYAVSQAYDINGNIVNKSDVGDYTYDPNRPQTLLSAGNTHTGYQYDANGSMTAGGGRQIAWSSFNKPTRMLKGDYAVEFHYDADHSRIRKVATVSGVNNTIDYFGKVYEKQTKGSEVNHKHHIYAGGQLVAMHIKQTKAGVQQPDETRYMHRDNLGSIDTITDGRGNVVERLSYDPWGKRRGGDWRLDEPGTQPLVLLTKFTNRGFTGHEHVDELNLIHMNGRVYDPELGRFLSADPHIQSPGSSQGYNRYAYVQNNPLKYTDPSGYFLSSLVSAIKGVFNKVGQELTNLVRFIASDPILGTFAQIAACSLGGHKAAPLGRPCLRMP